MNQGSNILDNDSGFSNAAWDFEPVAHSAVDMLIEAQRCNLLTRNIDMSTDEIVRERATYSHRFPDGTVVESDQPLKINELGILVEEGRNGQPGQRFWLRSDSSALWE